MIQVAYEQYLYTLGFGHYVYQHDYTNGHNTDVIDLNGTVVARIERGDSEDKYFIKAS